LHLPLSKTVPNFKTPPITMPAKQQIFNRLFFKPVQLILKLAGAIRQNLTFHPGFLIFFMNQRQFFSEIKPPKQQKIAFQHLDRSRFQNLKL